MHSIRAEKMKKVATFLLALIIGSFIRVGSVDASTPLPAQKPVLSYDTSPLVSSSVTKPMPTPLKKPDFMSPGVMQLLAFGQPPFPRKKPMTDPDISLSAKDAALYSKIFTYQATARWEQANEQFEKLEDYRLRGHVLFQRYIHPTAYRSPFEELVGWMDLYADHPGATRIYNLALARMPDDFKEPIRKPLKNEGVNGFLDILSDNGKRYVSSKKRTKGQRHEMDRLSRAIKKDLARGAPTKAYKRLLEDSASKFFDAVEYDQRRAQIANSYMLVGKLDKARDLAIASAQRSGNKTPTASWVGGLVAWRQGHYKLAASLFQLTATSPQASSWTASAGSYWTYRSLMRAGQIRQATPWLHSAAAHPRTFYGLIATRALGWDFDFNWEMPALTTAYQDKLKKTRAGHRAMALVASGQYHLAETELRQINPGKDKAMRNALLAYAYYAGLPSFSMRLGQAIQKPQGGLYDAALYPLSPWKPQGGYKVDRALIYALIRQESRFNPMAESRSGATGLMQLMPATASYVSGHKSYRNKKGQHSLKDPQTNLDIGQRYVENLLYQDHVGSELFSLVIAYNAGPGNLRKWKQKFSAMQDDPLLFVESIPMAETRAFVEKVMANYWIYRLRMKQGIPSLDAVTEGQWAHYIQMDTTRHAAVPTRKPESRHNYN